MNLDLLLDGVETKEVINMANPFIGDVCYNSANVKPDSLFIAIKGFKTDGHKYIADAVKRGAAAVVAEHPTDGLKIPQIIVEDSRIAEAIICANYFENPSKKFRLIGVTGTNGKTTVTHLVKHVLDGIGFRTGLIGTNQNMIGDKVIESSRTTPDAFELQKLFREMADAHVQYVVMEVSSHALELNRVYGCHFNVAAFTNLTQDHLDFHGDMESYAKAKAKLFDMCDVGVINADEPFGVKLAETVPCSVFLYGKKDKWSFWGKEISFHRGMGPKKRKHPLPPEAVEGMYLFRRPEDRKNVNSPLFMRTATMINPEVAELRQKSVRFLVDYIEYVLNIPGEFSLYNGLCTVAICRALDLNPFEVTMHLRNAEGVKGRAEIVDTDERDYTVMIDYAHTPDGLENILKTVRGFARGRVVVVFGCGGDRDNTKRAIMGKIAGELADFAVITSDNPRTEDPHRIIDMIEEGIKTTKGKYKVVENRRDAIKYALTHAEKDDVIVLAGKGHETYQILNTGTIHFDEREIIKEILAEESK